jgi:hypothetical protein
MQFTIVNSTTDPAITPAILLQIAEAMAIQIARDYAPMWQAAPMSVSVAADPASVPADNCIIHLVDTLSDPNDLGYHDVLAGRPDADIGWNAIKTNGGTLTVGANSLSVTISHEILEADEDPGCEEWVTMPDGKTDVADEVGDPVEGDGYPITVSGGAVVWVSNFVGPRWFEAGSPGPYDQMGKVAAPFTKDAGGYTIERLGGPGGAITDVFARTPEDGGMPEWKREEKRKRRRHARRHGKRP